MKCSKILAFRKFAALLLGTMLMVCSTAMAQDTPVFDRLKNQFEEGRVFSATFVHEFNDTFTGEQQLTEGTIWVGKDQYKIRSGGNLMVVDGRVSRVYDSSKDRVIVSDYVEDEDDFAPSRMLQGVDDTYTVTEESANNQTNIQLVSDDPFSVFLQVTIFVDENGYPLRIEAIDQVDNELITYFENGQFEPETSETFEFRFPEGVEWIDLRHDS